MEKSDKQIKNEFSESSIALLGHHRMYRCESESSASDILSVHRTWRCRISLGTKPNKSMERGNRILLFKLVFRSRDGF